MGGDSTTTRDYLHGLLDPDTKIAPRPEGSSGTALLRCGGRGGGGWGVRAGLGFSRVWGFEVWGTCSRNEVGDGEVERVRKGGFSAGRLGSGMRVMFLPLSSSVSC